MHALRRWAGAFLKRDEAASATQYAVVVALIAAACILGVKSLGTASNAQLNTANNQLQQQATGS